MKKKSVEYLRQKVIADYNQIALEWDKTRNFSWPEFDFMLDFLEPGMDFLDLGCGNGRLYGFALQQDLTYTGVDNSEELVKIAKKYCTEGRVMYGDVLALPFRDQEFDFVASVAVVHHLPGRQAHEQFMREVSRVLRPGGFFFLTTWNIFQPKYKKYIWQNRWRKIWRQSDLGWNDALIPFKSGRRKIERYVHGFTPREIESLAKRHFCLEKNWWVNKGQVTPNWEEAHNLCWMWRKPV